MNKTIGIILVILVLAGGVYLISRNGKPADNNSSATEESTTNTTNANSTKGTASSAIKTSVKTSNTEGRVIFSVTDAAVDLNSLSEINMKISKVEMKSSTGAWITASSTPHTYNLLSLNERKESDLLANINAKPGTYNQVRLVVDSIDLKSKSGSTTSAKLPSHELKINTTLTLKANSISSVNFDFLADKSLHTTGDGQYIFAPVVKTDVKSGASVTISDNNSVEVVGGNTDGASVVGMDVDGSVKVNFQIDPTQELSIDASGKIKIKGLLQ